MFLFFVGIQTWSFCQRTYIWGVENRELMRIFVTERGNNGEDGEAV
jgi:hypothetical protein